ncbi:hypothetical protein RTP6_003690 [Batrachochytrium dendrobatidis]
MSETCRASIMQLKQATQENNYVKNNGFQLAKQSTRTVKRKQEPDSRDSGYMDQLMQKKKILGTNTSAGNARIVASKNSQTFSLKTIGSSAANRPSYQPSKSHSFGIHSSNRRDVCSSPVRSLSLQPAIISAKQHASGGRRVGGQSKAATRCAIYPSFKAEKDAVPHPLVEEFRKAREQLLDDHKALELIKPGLTTTSKVPFLETSSKYFNAAATESQPPLTFGTPDWVISSSKQDQHSTFGSNIEKATNHRPQPNVDKKSTPASLETPAAESTLKHTIKLSSAFLEPSPFVHLKISNSDARIVSLASGLEHGLALSDDGRVWSLGGLHAHGFISHQNVSTDPAFDAANLVTKAALTAWRTHQGITPQLIQGLDTQPIKQIATTDHASFLLTKNTGIVFMFGKLTNPRTTGSQQWFYADAPSKEYVLVRLPPHVTGNNVQSIAACGNLVWMVTESGQVHTFGFAPKELSWQAPAKSGKEKKSTGKSVKQRNGIPFSTHTVIAMNGTKRSKVFINSVVLGPDRAVLTDRDGGVWVMGETRDKSKDGLDNTDTLDKENVDIKATKDTALYKPIRLDFGLNNGAIQHIACNDAHMVILREGKVYVVMNHGVCVDSTQTRSVQDSQKTVAPKPLLSLVNGIANATLVSILDDCGYAIDANGQAWRWLFTDINTATKINSPPTVFPCSDKPGNICVAPHTLIEAAILR